MGPREIQRGQVLSGIPSNSWNAFVDATRKINALVGRGNGQASSDQGSTVFIQVRNDTDALVPVGGILVLSDVLFLPADRESVVFEGLQFSGLAPDSTGTDYFYVVALEPIAEGKIGRGVIQGASWARINLTSEDHGFVKHGSNPDYLVSNEFRGRPIIWRALGTGEQWAIVGLNPYDGIDMGEASGLIDAMGTDASTVEGVHGNMGGIGIVNFQFGAVPDTFNCINATGRPIWNGARCYMHGRGVITGTDAADIISGDWDGVGSKTEIQSYTLAAAGLGHFDSTGVVNARFSISDPLSLLTDVTALKPGVLFSTGGLDASPFNRLTVLTTEAGGGGGGGGDPWVGWPGPDPTTGTAPTKIFKALVNSAGGVASGASVPFDTTTSIVGTAPASGTATNPGFAFSDNEIIYVVAGSTNNYYAIKQSINIIKALVNEANHVNEGNGTFAFDNGSALLGLGPSSGTATNPHAEWFANNEELTLFQNSSNQWVPFERQTSALFEVTVQISAASWNAGTHELTEGSGSAKRLKNKNGSSSVHDQYTTLTYTLKHGGSGTIPVGKQVKADWTNGRWLIDVNYCR